MELWIGRLWNVKCRISIFWKIGNPDHVCLRVVYYPLNIVCHVKAVYQITMFTFTAREEPLTVTWSICTSLCWVDVVAVELMDIFMLCYVNYRYHKDTTVTWQRSLLDVVVVYVICDGLDLSVAVFTSTETALARYVYRPGVYFG